MCVKIVAFFCYYISSLRTTFIARQSILIPSTSTTSKRQKVQAARSSFVEMHSLANFTNQMQITKDNSSKARQAYRLCVTWQCALGRLWLDWSFLLWVGFPSKEVALVIVANAQSNTASNRPLRGSGSRTLNRSIQLESYYCLPERSASPLNERRDRTRASISIF